MNKLGHVVGKHIDVSLYSNLSASFPDRKLAITEVIPEEEKQEILGRYIPHLEGINAEPLAVTLGDEMLFVGSGDNNMGKIYYIDIEFGVFPLDKTLQVFIEKLVNSR